MTTCSSTGIRHALRLSYADLAVRGGSRTRDIRVHVVAPAFARSAKVSYDGSTTNGGETELSYAALATAGFEPATFHKLAPVDALTM